AVFDRSGCVYPYPKPLSLHSDDGDRVQRLYPEALGGCVGRTRLSVGLITVTKYKREALERAVKFNHAVPVTSLSGPTYGMVMTMGLEVGAMLTSSCLNLFERFLTVVAKDFPPALAGQPPDVGNDSTKCPVIVRSVA